MIGRVKIENIKGHKYTLRVSNADTGEEISVSRIELLWDAKTDDYVARLDIPYPILDLVAPAEVNDGC